MSKRNSSTTPPKNVNATSAGKPRRLRITHRTKLLIIGIVSCLVVASGTLAQLGLLRRTAPRAMTSTSAAATAAEVGCSPNPSFVPGNPAKEYIYAGGRLLATEEATDRLNPDPCIDANGCRIPNCVSPVGEEGTTYDVVRDFSATQNPTGTWSYGYRAGVPSSFTPYTTQGDPHGMGAGMSTWYLPSPYSLPVVIYNGTGAPHTYNSVIIQPTDVLNVHPGPAGERSVVRWTAPRAATITIEGRFEVLDTRATPRDVAITHNANTTLFQIDFGGSGVRQTFNLTRTVAAGDTINFSVGYGSDNNLEGDSTGLAVTITSQY